MSDISFFTMLQTKTGDKEGVIKKVIDITLECKVCDARTLTCRKINAMTSEDSQ
jgi:hypothetical protein